MNGAATDKAPKPSSQDVKEAKDGAQAALAAYEATIQKQYSAVFDDAIDLGRDGLSDAQKKEYDEGSAALSAVQAAMRTLALIEIQSLNKSQEVRDIVNKLNGATTGLKNTATKLTKLADAAETAAKVAAIVTAVAVKLAAIAAP